MGNAPEPLDPKPCKVMIDDNFHYMDASCREAHGAFATREEAVAACKAIVEASLRDSLQPGMTAEELFRHYAGFGDDPFILAPDSHQPGIKRFSAWDYARERARTLTTP